MDPSPRPTLPHHPHRHREQPIPKRQRVLAIVEHGSGREAFAQGISQLREAAEVLFSDRAARLHLHARELPALLLEHQIDLEAVAISEVVELERSLVPARLPAKLTVDERLEELAEKRAILRESGSGSAATKPMGSVRASPKRLLSSREW